jgi:WD40 repeat protein
VWNTDKLDFFRFLPVLRLRGHQDQVTSVTFSNDGRFIATAGRDNTTKVWDAVSGDELFSLPGHGNGFTRAVSSPREPLLATSGPDNAVKVWDVSSYRGPYLSGHTSLITTFAISSDQKLLATASLDKTVRVWDASTGEERWSYEFTAPVYSIAFRRDGKRLAVAGKDGFATVLGLPPENEKRLKPLFSLIDPNLNSLVLVASTVGLMGSPHGQGPVLAASRIHARTKELEKAHLGDIWQIAFSEDGKQLATASWDKTAKVWGTSLDKQECSLRHTLAGGHTDRVYSVAFSSDGNSLATGSQDRTVYVWDISTKRSNPKSRIEATGTVSTVTFYGNGLLATGSDDGGVQLCEPSVAPGPAWRVAKAFRAHSASVLQVTFSNDGKYLATASADRTAAVWELTTTKLVHVVAGHEAPVSLVAFSPPSPKEVLITATIANGVQTGHVYKNTLKLDDLLSDAQEPDRYFREWRRQQKSR